MESYNNDTYYGQENFWPQDELVASEILNIGSQAFLQIYGNLLSSQLSISQPSISAAPSQLSQPTTESQLFSQIPDSQKMTIHKAVNDFKEHINMPSNLFDSNLQDHSAAESSSRPKSSQVLHHYPRVASDPYNFKEEQDSIKRVILDMTRLGQESSQGRSDARLYSEEEGGTVVIPCRPNISEITLHYPSGTRGHSLLSIISSQQRRNREGGSGSGSGTSIPLGNSSQDNHVGASTNDEQIGVEQRKRIYSARRSTPRVRKSPEQRAILLEYFRRDRFPTLGARETIAFKTGLKDSQVRLWFQHQRNKVSIKGRGSKKK